MGSLALLAKEKGFIVAGMDAHIYPPMSVQLKKAGIPVDLGYDENYLAAMSPDLIIVGNALSRGNAVVEAILDKQWPYRSGPQFLFEYIMRDRWRIAISGTHGKTTTAAMLVWILEYAQQHPGFLIGGVPKNFGISARLGQSKFFVVEADEYDTAFFDKRSKFVHYAPRILLINNIEFDHADIFHHLTDIQKQFHYLIRTVPRCGRIIAFKHDTAVRHMLTQGCWTPVEWIGEVGSGWSYQSLKKDDSHFNVQFKKETIESVKWPHTGVHNMQNALGAIAVAHHLGIPLKHACDALSCFKGIKRRMELLACINGVRVYDDFAHHPTAMAQTLSGWHAHTQDQRNIRAVIEPRSNTMMLGVHKKMLGNAVRDAHEVIWFEPEHLTWSLQDVVGHFKNVSHIFKTTKEIIDYLVKTAQPRDDIVIMSNGGFNNLHHELIRALRHRVSKVT